MNDNKIDDNAFAIQLGIVFSPVDEHPLNDREAILDNMIERAASAIEDAYDEWLAMWLKN